MFLTQPPQKSIRFGLRYQYLPGVRDFITITNETGIRFGDLLAHFAREPGLMKQAIHARHQLYPYKKWLRNSEFAELDRIVWTLDEAIVEGNIVVEEARANVERRRKGEAETRRR
jgi:hypothetical protein